MAPFPPSGLGSAPYPPSSTTAATIPSSTERNLTFASEWYFKPEGVKLVKQKFEVELRKRRIEASCRWKEEDQTFRVFCLLRDVGLVWQMFYKVIVEIIEAESGEDSNDSDSETEWSGNYEEDPPFRSNLIEPLHIWRKEHGIKDTSAQTQIMTCPGTVNTVPVSNYQELLADSYDGPPSTAVAALSETFPEAIKYYKSRTSWSVGAELDLDQIASDKDLKELEYLTGCQFVRVLNEHKIYIGAHFEENCSLAILKLDNLRKYPRMDPYLDHLFYSEGEENFQVVLKPIVDIRMRYFETTLLEHLRLHPKCDYKNLSSAITVRIAPYNHSKCTYASVKSVHIVPAVKPEEKDRGLTAWKEFKYSAKGESTEYHRFLAMATQANDSAFKNNTPAPLQPAPVQPINNRQNKNASIQRWANEIPEIIDRPSGHLMQGLSKSGGDDAIHSSTNKKPEKHGWDTYKQFDDTIVVRKESTVRQHSTGLATRLSAMISAQVLQARAPQLSVLQGSVQSQRLRAAASTGPAFSFQTRQPASAMSAKQGIARQSTTHPLRTLQPASQPRVARQPAQINRAPTWSPSQSTAQHTMALENARPSSNTRPTAMASAGNSDPGFDNFFYQYPQRSILDNDISMVEYTDPLMQPIKLEERAIESESSRHLGSESMQPLSEVATRSFHNTMNQRAPKHKHNTKPNPYAGRLPGPPPNPVNATPVVVGEIQVIDPLPEFVKEVNESFSKMMEYARGFRGQVEVQAEFGRVLLNNIHKKDITPRGSTDRLHATEKLQDWLLSAQPGFDTYFTKVLSTSSGEIPYILDLTKGDGKALWNKICVWSVKYELYFQDGAAFQNRRFIIEIDAETFVTQIKSWRLLGNIFIHGVGRHWDFRIAANGYESDKGLEEEYGPLATAIELSLHVPANSSTPVLFFQLEESMSERFQLAEIRVNRICQYKSTDTKSVLKISELQSLEVQKVAVPGKLLTIFKLSPGPSDHKPCQKLERWYEVSISSSQFDELLEENKKLQLGEETRWTVKDLLDTEVAQSIYLSACEMLKKMDGVGQYNHNGLNVRSGVTSTTESKVSENRKDLW